MHTQSLKGNCNGFRNADSGRLVGRSYPTLLVRVCDGMFNRAFVRNMEIILKDVILQNCFQKWVIRKVINPKYSR
jgi:hypothetical protein